jgi:hypothetical protein
MTRVRDLASKTFWLPGEVIQVVTLENPTRAAQTFSTNTILNVYQMDIRITPKRANSKILVQMRWFGEMADAGRPYNSVFGLSRNGTQVGRQEGTSTIITGLTSAALSYDGSDANSTPETASFFVTDMPNTTSEISYKVTFISDQGGTLYTGQTVGWANQAGGYELGTNAMTATEIAQ